MYTLTLVHPDSSTFIVGGFASQDAINIWLDSAQKEPGWIAGTTTSIVQATPASS